MADRVSQEDPQVVVQVVAGSAGAEFHKLSFSLGEVINGQIQSQPRLDVAIPGSGFEVHDALTAQAHVTRTGQVHGIFAAVDGLPAGYGPVERRQRLRIRAR